MPQETSLNAGVDLPLARSAARYWMNGAGAEKGASKKVLSVPSGPANGRFASSPGVGAPRHWKRTEQPPGTSARQETAPPSCTSETNDASAA